jgi:hypothetical protein
MAVYTGADGSITLSTCLGIEGRSAQDVIDDYEMLSIGKAQDVRIEVHSEVRPFHELGSRFPTELRSGSVAIRGSIGRAYINGAMLKLLLGQAASQRQASGWVQPAFNMSLVVQSPDNPGVHNTLTLHDVKIENWTYSMPEGDFVLESVDFQALYISVRED